MRTAVHTSVASRITDALDAEVASSHPLSGGCVGDVALVSLSDGRRLVVKSAASADARLDIEGQMLSHLASNSSLHVPAVFLSEPTVLAMEYLQDAPRPGDFEERAADALAALHDVTPVAPREHRFGFEQDTLIGGLPQANTWCDSWVAFFARHRLANMAHQACSAGRCEAALVRRIESFAEKLSEFIEEPARPSLVHGDVWGGNVLCSRDGAGQPGPAFIDPAIYYGHAEVELAFITLFSTFGPAFFARYQEHRPIDPGFFESRRDIYNLYPLLVHVRLFGGSYVGQVEQILRRFGA